MTRLTCHPRVKTEYARISTLSPPPPPTAVYAADIESDIRTQSIVVFNMESPSSSSSSGPREEDAVKLLELGQEGRTECPEGTQS